MNAMSVSYRHRNPTENSPKFSPYCVFPHAIAILFFKIPDMPLHYDPMFDSLYIVGSCRFRLYPFSHKDFAIPLFHLAFDSSIPYFAIPLHVAHPSPPPPPAAPTTPRPLHQPHLPNWSPTFSLASIVTLRRPLTHLSHPPIHIQTTPRPGLIWATAS